MLQPTAAARRAGQQRLALVPGGLAPPVDVFPSKLRVPELPAGTVSRTAVVNRLRAERSLRLATVVAPAGYGKTILLAQWAERDERPFVWLSVDERDNDPLTLIRHLAAALDAAFADGDVWKVAAPRLVNAFAARERPFVAVLDDADLIGRGASADVIALLAENVPEGSMLVLTGRVAPRIGVARLRASRRLLELGVGELALSLRDAQLMLRGAGVELEPAEVADLGDRTEGWPAGLYLLARGRAGERHLDDYFESEHLAGLTPERLAFLERASVLDRLCGSLCEAVTGSLGAAAELRAIERAGLFLVPLDGGGYRYHRLFRETLLRRLEEGEPELVPVLHRRAADWFESRGEPEAALDHVQASGDVDRSARMLTEVALPAHHAGRAPAVDTWLAGFETGASLAGYPDVAAIGAWIHALRGRALDSERWLDAADGPAAGLVRVALCRGSADELERVLAAVPDATAWDGAAALLRGGLESMRGDDPRPSLAEAARTGSGDVQLAALGVGSLAAAADGDHAEAERRALEARAIALDGPLGAYPTAAVARAAAARVFLKQSRWEAARHELLAAEPLAQLLAETLPWLALETLLALAGAYVALRDRAAALARVADAEAVLARHECLAALRARVDDVRRQLDELPEAPDGRNAGLTGAELRLLPLLATHLSFREIGGRLYVSRNTIKTQAISAYRKLGVSSRSAAVERARELGLVADATAPPGGFTQPG
jgi:LuxR family transcriptional regulator, maltose regulon positive regulatory protein